MMFRMFRGASGVLVFLLCAGWAGASQAQFPGLLLLHPDHEVLRAVRLLEAAGHVGPLPPQRALRVGTVARALMEATEHPDPWVSGTALTWLARLPHGPTGASAEVMARSHSGVAAPGWGYYEPGRTGAEPHPDTLGFRAGAGLRAELDRGYAAARASLGDGGHVLDFAEAALAAGPFIFSAGRTPQGYGRGTRGIVLSGAHHFDALMVEMPELVVLPGPLRHLGPFAAHSALSRLPEIRHPGAPYFWIGAFSLHPHPRFAAAVHRAAIFSGGTDPERITLRNVLFMLMGKHVPGHFENQVVSVEFGYRLPTESVQPIFAYLEWGAEDSAGAFKNVPGRIYGILLPGFAFAPRASLRVERASFGESCCGNPEWYRHGSQPGGWASSKRPFGHGLGGHGEETRVEMGASSGDARLSGRLGVARRHRHAENLYVPGREGESWRLDGQLRWGSFDGPEVTVGGWRETGSEWIDARLAATLTFHF
jgi:hypothetical protein